MTTNNHLSFLLGFIFLILGFGIQARPLDVAAGPEWQKIYNLTTGDCPSYFGNLSKEQYITQYACQSGCPGQYHNSTEVQCIPPGLTEEQAESQGLLYIDDQGDSWSPGSCQCGENEDDGSLSERQAKQPLDITQYGYSMVFEETLDSPVEGIQEWAISSEKSKRPSDTLVDKLGYKPSQNTLYVFEAWNAYDLTKNRLKLRDISVGWYNAKADQPLSSLNSIYLQTVVESGTDKAMQEARHELGSPGRVNEDITVYAGDTEPKRKAAFEKLMGTKFGQGFSKMLEEYADLQGKAIVAFSMPGDMYHYGDLEIVLSGSNSGMGEGEGEGELAETT